jgi:phosphoribosylamine--glycine ligase
MNILIIDAGGTCLDWALRCKAYGHNVRAFIRHNKDGSRSEVGDGLIQRVPHWEPHMQWADFIFCTDNTFYINSLEHYRKKGYPIFGPSVDANQWEQRRDIGEAIHQRVGVETIPCQKFNNYDAAIKYVMETNKRYVSKPIGDGDKALSYVSKSPADLVFMLQKWKKAKAHKGDFILQEFRPGIEMAVGGWFGGCGFSKHWCENWEFKKLMNDDLGVATGEQGTILRYTEQSKLADCVLKPLEGLLHGLGYTGYIDVNCIITDDGTPWPLEFTMRPGWPLFQIQQALHKGDPVEWMCDLIDGRDTLKVSSDIACGVVISMPDYPYSNLTKKECSGYPLFGITVEDVLKDVHLSEVQWGKAPDNVDGEVKLDVPMFVTAGDYIATITGTGSTVCEAKEKCYKTIKKKIEIPNSIMYRTDVGCRLEKQLPELHAMGYCEDMVYEEGEE